MGIEPDDGEPVVPRREPADRADVRAAAAAEHERPLREPARDRPDCSSSESRSTTSASGYASSVQAASAIASPPSPHARGTRTSPAANEAPQLWHS